MTCGIHYATHLDISHSWGKKTSAFLSIFNGVSPWFRIRPGSISSGLQNRPKLTIHHDLWIKPEGPSLSNPKKCSILWCFEEDQTFGGRISKSCIQSIGIGMYRCILSLFIEIYLHIFVHFDLLTCCCCCCCLVVSPSRMTKVITRDTIRVISQPSHAPLFHWWFQPHLWFPAPSGKLTVCDWKWPGQNNEFSQKKCGSPHAYENLYQRLMTTIVIIVIIVVIT